MTKTWKLILMIFFTKYLEKFYLLGNSSLLYILEIKIAIISHDQNLEIDPHNIFYQILGNFSLYNKDTSNSMRNNERIYF